MPRPPILLAALSLAACGFGEKEPTVIDGSSQQAYEETLRAAKAELGAGDRLKFEAALAEFRAQTFAKADDRTDYQRRLRAGLDGLTSQRVVAQFDRNVDKAGRDAADALFDAKRAITGRRSDTGEE